MDNKLAVVVVGATGEMGRVVTSRLAQKGFRVIAVARSRPA